eukprot:scaffold51462_cov65-Phaeocystis_antarctica.AAC.2
MHSPTAKNNNSASHLGPSQSSSYRGRLIARRGGFKRREALAGCRLRKRHGLVQRDLSGGKAFKADLLGLLVRDAAPPAPVWL